MALFPRARTMLAWTACASALLLVGCKDAPSGASAPTLPASAAAAPAAGVSVAVVAAEGVGFSVGSTLAAHTVYVFFDPQCPHCNALWKAARPLKSQARFVWMPVGLLNDSSRRQGAALLAATDPVAAMDAHEASMQAKTGGIAEAASGEPQLAAVASNTALLTRLGFSAIPTVVATHAKTGALVTQEGSLTTPALAELLGLQAPAAAPGS